VHGGYVDENDEDVSMEEWRVFATSDDPLVRCDAAENFPEVGDRNEVASVLISMLEDEDELVRTEVAESLAFFKLDAVREALWRRFDVEISDLVKGYLISSIGEVGDMRDFPSLLELSESSQNGFVGPNVLAGMQRLVSRYAVGKLCTQLEAAPDRSGPAITSLMVFLHVFWLQDVAGFVSETEPFLNREHRIWVDQFTALKTLAEESMRKLGASDSPRRSD
jgi:HEAT repeat protein